MPGIAPGCVRIAKFLLHSIFVEDNSQISSPVQALTRTSYGAPEVLTLADLPRPVPKTGELLVEVHATTVNRTDCALLRGSPWLMRLATGLFRPRRRVMGTDFAGRVAAAGAGVTEFQVGERVWGFHDEGLSSQAAYLIIRQDRAVVPVPEGVAYTDMVCAAEGAYYAYHFLNKIELSPASEVLINGASGAIGSALLQLLKYHGATVTAVCGTSTIPLIESLGADRIIDYERENFTQLAHPYDYVLDAVGKSRFSACRSLLRPGGAYLSSELGERWENVYLPLLTRFTGSKRVIFPIPSNIRETLLFMNELVREGRFRAVIDRVYPLEEIIDAYRYVETGQKMGNVVITY